MALNYIVTKRIFGFDKTKTEKYVTRAVGSGKVTFAKLCQKLAQFLGIHRGVVQLVLAGLVDFVIAELEDGKSVQLGELGTFRASINSKAVGEEKDADAGTIVRRKIIFTPGTALKDAVNKISVTRYANPDTDWTDGSSKSGNTGKDPGNEDDGYEQDPNA